MDSLSSHWETINCKEVYSGEAAMLLTVLQIHCDQQLLCNYLDTSGLESKHMRSSIAFSQWTLLDSLAGPVCPEKRELANKLYSKNYYGK